MSNLGRVFLILGLFSSQVKSDRLSDRLIAAAAEGDVAEIPDLLLCRANVDGRDATGRTALHAAAESGYYGIVFHLIKAGATVDAMDSLRETPLHKAAKAGHEKVVETLMRQGANKEARNKDGKRPLDFATGAVVGVILSIDAANFSEEEGLTRLRRAVLREDIAEVRRLLAKGAKYTNQCNLLGFSPLHWAAFEGKRKEVLVLLRAGADTEARDFRGRRAIDLAYARGHQDVVNEMASFTRGF